MHPFEVRKTGSAAIECAFVAAGLLRVARFERPNVWDIAGGIALVQAAGGDVRTLASRAGCRSKTSRRPGEGEEVDIRNWHQPIILGEAEAVELLCRVHSPRPSENPAAA